MIKKSILSVIFLSLSLCSQQAPLQAFTKKDLHDFCTTSGNIILLQELVIMLTMSYVNISTGKSYLAKEYHNLSKILVSSINTPHHVAATALELDRSVVGTFLESFVLNKITGDSAWSNSFISAIDAIIYNQINNMVLKNYPNASEEVKRRVLRVSYMAMLRAIKLLAIHGIILSSDTNSKANAHFDANIDCITQIAYEVLLETAGYLVNIAREDYHPTTPANLFSAA
jgi:hypothetical protein